MVSLWASHFITLRLSFLIPKMGMKVATPELSIGNTVRVTSHYVKKKSAVVLHHF